MKKLFASNTNAAQQPGGPMQKVQTQFLLASAQIDDKKSKDMGGGGQPTAPVAIHPGTFFGVRRGDICDFLSLCFYLNF
jgi:hypothetical protein